MSCELHVPCPYKNNYESEVMCPHFDGEDGYNQCLLYSVPVTVDDDSDNDEEPEKLPFLIF